MCSAPLFLQMFPFTDGKTEAAVIPSGVYTLSIKKRPPGLGLAAHVYHPST